MISNSIEEDIRVRDPFLVKLFFSGEIDTAVNIETMKKFKQFCEYASTKIKETISQFEEADGGNKNFVYWQSTASFGVYYYEMCIRWAEDTIKKLEGLI